MLIKFVDYNFISFLFTRFLKLIVKAIINYKKCSSTSFETYFLVSNYNEVKVMFNIVNVISYLVNLYFNEGLISL